MIFSSILNKKKSAQPTKIVHAKFHQQRAQLFVIGIFLLFFILMGRAVILQLSNYHASNLETIAERQYKTPHELAPFRGTIYDHKKHPLAISIETPAIAINPKIFKETTSKDLHTLAKLLHIPKEKILSLLKRDTHFAWLKHKVPYDTAEKIKKLNLKGMHFILEPTRFYPEGHHAASLIGYVGTENAGLLGIEYAFDASLKGIPLHIVRLKDAKGQWIYTHPQSVSANPKGFDLTLTLDLVIQGIAEQALEKWVTKSKARRGFIIVADPHTGRILSLANYPSFDPNDSQSLNIENTKNIATSDTFEPGSIVKPFVIAQALENKITHENELHYCENGAYEIEPGLAIHDDHKIEYATTTEIISNSSNICTFKIAKKLGKNRLFQIMNDFFLKFKKPLGLPGEVSGSIAQWTQWKEIRFANIAFGQGFLVSGLEVIQAYSAIANGGNLIKPYIIENFGNSLKKENESNPQRIPLLSTETTMVMRRMLTKVVTEGTGTKAQTQDYTVAGKTGTVEKIDPKTKIYSKNLRVASFAGFAPVKDPHLVIYVLIDEPQEKPYYGGVWAAPAFAEVAQSVLKYLNVEPDKKNSLTQGEHLKNEIKL